MRENKTYDAELLLKDSGAVATSAAATVDGAPKIITLGQGLVEADLIIDVAAIEIADNDEIYTIALQGSDTADFTTGSPAIEELAVLQLGAHEVLGGNADSSTGRYVVPARNERGGTVYPFVRVYTTVGGTVATGIDYTAWLAID